MLPVIGLTTYREESAWGVWAKRADVLHSEYADMVVAAGGAPVLLPPASADPAVAAAVVGRLDGLLVSGGADVDPTRYAEQAHPRTAGWRPDRDAWELALLDAAEATGLPVLGVCRGMQLMAVRAGGSLDQHTPDLVGHDDHSPGGAEFGVVEVTTMAGSRVAGLLGPTVVADCHHHQSVRDHPGFVASATAADGTIEAMELPGDRFCVAVQWHPEVGTELALLRALVTAASDVRRSA
ncbi:MAG: gamma-glutamyl-gamma-aminobutyrate hydrolase family protein [Propionicimonas sp.]